MDADGARLFQHMNQIGDRGASDNGIIHQNQAFPLYYRRQNIQFQPDAVFPFLLGRL